MIVYTTANTTTDLQQILTLQKANLSEGLTVEEKQSQGFVTVNHSYDQLKSLNDLEKHIIAKHNDNVIGYLLAMTKKSQFEIPILVPMFDAFGSILYENKKVAKYNYLVVGQVCIDKAYRGQGILDHCYAAYKEYYSAKYDFAITEIASDNLRSLNAHRRIGFKEIHSYVSPGNTEWVVVIWDWKKVLSR